MAVDFVRVALPMRRRLLRAQSACSDLDAPLLQDSGSPVYSTTTSSDSQELRTPSSVVTGSLCASPLSCRLRDVTTGLDLQVRWDPSGFCSQAALPPPCEWTRWDPSVSCGAGFPLPHGLARSTTADSSPRVRWDPSIPCDTEAPPPPYKLVRSATADSDPQSPVSDGGLGYASTLQRQASIPEAAKLSRQVCAVRDGKAGLRDGTYLFVVMVGDSNHIRLMHEESLMASGWEAGHSSLVSHREFTGNWAQQWKACRPRSFRHTVLFAGELEYKEGVGVTYWNNCSGHYKPDSKDHLRVPLSPETFVPVDLA